MVYKGTFVLNTVERNPCRYTLSIARFVCSNSGCLKRNARLGGFGSMNTQQT